MVPLRRSDNQLKRLTEASSTVPVVGSCYAASPRVSRGGRERPPKASLHDLPKTLRSDNTDALSSVVQRDTAIHPSIATKMAPRFEFRTLLNQRMSCSHKRAGLPAQRTQLRMDWFLLDQMARRRRG